MGHSVGAGVAENLASTGIRSPDSPTRSRTYVHSQIQFWLLLNKNLTLNEGPVTACVGHQTQIYCYYSKNRPDETRTNFCCPLHILPHNNSHTNFHYPFKDEAQTALFKDPVRTAQ